MIDIVIVNWNSGEQLRECLESVREHRGVVVRRIIVVDNGSSDGSFNNLPEMVGVEVILAGRNLGFAAACNLGAKNSTAPYLLFLNPDTRLYVASLSTTLELMEGREGEKTGICGIQLIDESGGVSRTCARFPTFNRLAAASFGLDRLPWMRGTGVHMSDWDHSETREVDHVIGAFYLIRGSLFRHLGGFDERFFVYLEDVDLSLRSREAGWRTVYLTTAQAFHAGGGVSRQVKAKRLFYSLRSRLQYAEKHFTPPKAIAVAFLTWTVEPVTRVALCALRRDWRGARDTISGYRMLLTGR